jgi:transcriptional regulator with XRE-family HTH domain
MDLDFMELGQRMAKRRRVLNWTQEDLAEHADVTTTHVRNIERAHTKCSVEVLYRLCAAMEVTPDYLFFGVVKYPDERLVKEINDKLKICSRQQPHLFNCLLTSIYEMPTS